MGIVLVIIIIFVSATGAGADIYRQVSEDGVIFFTNTPLDGSESLILREKKKLDSMEKNNKQKFNHNLQKTDSVVNRISKETFHVIAEQKAREYDLDPELVKAIITAESNWNPDAVSPKGAQGLMQLMPSTAWDMRVANTFDPIENIEGGVKYLKYLLKKFGGDLNLALAAYNAGPNRVEKIKNIPPIPETRNYVRKVINTYISRKDLPVRPDYAQKTSVGSNKIYKILSEDGIVLYTNAYLAQ